MAASLSSVTLAGYGNGTFNGSVALVVTMGYGIGAAAVVQPNDGWIAKTRQRLLVAKQRERVWIAKDR